MALPPLMYEVQDNQVFGLLSTHLHRSPNTQLSANGHIFEYSAVLLPTVETSCMKKLAPDVLLVLLSDFLAGAPVSPVEG